MRDAEHHAEPATAVWSPPAHQADPGAEAFPHAHMALRCLAQANDLAAVELRVHAEHGPLRLRFGAPVGKTDAAVEADLPDGESHHSGVLLAVPTGTAGERLRELAIAVVGAAAIFGALLDADAARAAAMRQAHDAGQQALTDPLTGLGNRRAWQTALPVEAQRASRAGSPLAIVVVDLDGLKQVNDARGHRHGDELLVRAASALVQSARATDTVCRLGGDEFGVTGLVRDARHGHALATRLDEALANAGVAASTGAAIGEFGADDTVAALWQRADEAMYRRKPSNARPRLSESAQVIRRRLGVTR